MNGQDADEPWRPRQLTRARLVAAWERYQHTDRDARTDSPPPSVMKTVAG